MAPISMGICRAYWGPEGPSGPINNGGKAPILIVSLRGQGPLRDLTLRVDLGPLIMGGGPPL